MHFRKSAAEQTMQEWDRATSELHPACGSDWKMGAHASSVPFRIEALVWLGSTAAGLVAPGAVR